MKAAFLNQPGPIARRPLTIGDLPQPFLAPGHTLLRVLACGVCHTDLHIVEGELAPLHSPIVPGHQIVGEVVGGGTPEFPLGTRVGASWIGGVDGTCEYCRLGLENLCDSPIFTGYSVNGGFAEFVAVRTDFLLKLPQNLTAAETAPLLCAGIIGFRSLRIAGVEPGDRVGLFGFGSSASLMVPVLQSWGCEIYVSTRGCSHRKQAEASGAIWVGSETDKPPVSIDRAITFAPSGEVVVAALGSLRKGGVVAINAIHLDYMPEFNYDKLLWGERQIRSVANMTRTDARDFLQLAGKLCIKPHIKSFSLDEANEALLAIRNGSVEGSAVLVMQEL